METAFLLVNCEINKKDLVLQDMQKISGVKDIKKVFGAYDIIAKVESSSETDLKQKVIKSIRDIPRVRSTVTLPVTYSN